ncbi:MAG: DUF6483 family protein [Myxococcota bacterium]
MTEPGDDEQRLTEARDKLDRATPMVYEGRADEAATLYREAMDTLEPLGRDPRAERLRSSCLDGLGAVAGQAGRLDEAEARHREALDLRRALEGEAGEPSKDLRVAIAVSCMNLSSVLAAAKRIEEAEALTGEALERLDPDDPEPAVAAYRLGARQALALAYAGVDRMEESAAVFREAVAETRRALDSDDEGLVASMVPAYVQLMLNASMAFFHSGEPDEACAAADEAAEVAETVFEESQEPGALGQYLTAQMHLLDFHEAAGRFAKAEDALFKALDVAGPHAELIERGRRFYRGLLDLDDEALESGDLPRDEVRESLEDLESRSHAGSDE